MENLWRCVITETGVLQWKKNDGTYESTASLRALSNAQLFARLCGQLEGPRPMTIRDMTEIQYLGLMLNVCSGALPLDTPISNSFNGSVADAITNIENALNTNTNLEYWKTVADQINNRVGVNAPACPDDDAIFRNIPPCASLGPNEGTGSGTEMTLEATSGVFESRSFPNPVLGGSTVITYTVPGRMGRSGVEVAVFDAGGRLLRRLVDEAKDPGSYTVTWDLTDDGGSRVASGIYFYRVLAAGEKLTRKMLVLRR
jgi:hypothetical protein